VSCVGVDKSEFFNSFQVSSMAGKPLETQLDTEVKKDFYPVSMSLSG